MSASQLLQLSHLRRVRLLYKTILRLHRSLPDELQILGDNYVKEEFRLHKTASPDQTAVFMEAWAKYAVTVSEQVGIKSLIKGNVKLGENFKPEELDHFSEDQLCQLYELYKEASKVPDENDGASS